ncbi:MAG: NYN domain-containing protein [Myxococcota bacterium]
MDAVALFVDYENVYISLARHATHPLRHIQVVRLLLSHAQRVGIPRHLLAFADWDRFPGAQRTLATAGFETRYVPTSHAGKNSADLALQLELLKLLTLREAPEIFMLASGDRDFLTTLEEIRRQGRRGVVLGVDDSTSSVLKKHAHRFIPLVLADESSWGAEQERATTPSGSPQSLGEQEGEEAREGLSHERIDISVERPKHAAVAETGLSVGGGARAGGLRVPTSLALHEEQVGEGVRQVLAQVLQERGQSWCSYRLLCQALVSRGVTTEGGASRSLDAAVEAGLIQREEVYQEGRRQVRFLLGPSSSVRVQVRGQGRSPLTRPVSGRGGEAAEVERARVGGPPALVLRLEPWQEDWRSFTFVRMVWVLDDLFRDKPERFYATPSTLQEHLNPLALDQSEEERYFWLHQAVDCGFLRREVKEQPGQLPPRLYRYYFQAQHPLVSWARELPRAVVASLDRLQQLRPEWPGAAFNYLLKLLSLHPLVAHLPLELNPARQREWLNFLLQEGLLTRQEVPDAFEPDRRTTLVCLERTHPRVKALLSLPAQPRVLPDAWAMLLTVLTLDHFLHWLRLRAPEEDWLPLVTLKGWLRELLGEQLTRLTLAQCEQEGLIQIERFANKGAGEATVAGVRLRLDAPHVQQVLQQRDAALRLVLSLLRHRAVVPSGLLEQRLQGDGRLGESMLERLAWLPLLEQTRVLLVEREEGQGFEPRRGWVCRLNTREKFVGALVSRLLQGTTDGQMSVQSSIQSAVQLKVQAKEKLRGALDGDPEPS